MAHKIFAKIEWMVPEILGVPKNPSQTQLLGPEHNHHIPKFIGHLILH